MTAKVRIGANTATVEDYRWTSDSAGLERSLNAMLDPSGPSGADPNPDLTAAQKAVKRLGGGIVEFDETEYIEGRVY